MRNEYYIKTESIASSLAVRSCNICVVTMTLFAACQRRGICLKFDANWSATWRNDTTAVCVVVVTSTGNFAKGYETLWFETSSHQSLVNYVFQSCGYRPLWLNEREFQCCVTRIEQDPCQCSTCGKSVKNERAMKRHRKLYHFKN
jgi:hypothetical protein